MRRDRLVEKDENRPQKDALVLGSASHVIIGIIGELKDVGREGSLLVGGVAILRGILEENGVRVAGDVFVRIHGDKGGGIERGVYIVSEKTFSEARDYDVVRDVWQCGEVGDILELLMVG